MNNDFNSNGNSSINSNFTNNNINSEVNSSMTSSMNTNFDVNALGVSGNSDLNNNVLQNNPNQIETNQVVSSRSESSQNSNISNSNNKKIVIILIVVIIIVVGILLFKKLDNKSFVNDSFSIDMPIRVKKDDKYGYINTKGDFIIDPIYDEASEFRGDYAEVGLVQFQDGEEEILHQIIDKNGNVKISVDYYANIDYISEYGVWIIAGVLYDSSLRRLSDEGVDVRYEDEGYLSWDNSNKHTGGIMKINGEITYTYNFVDDEIFISIDPSDIDDTLSERYCEVNVENEKYAIVNCDTGKIVYDFTNKYIFGEFNNIFKVYEKDNDDSYSNIYIQSDAIALQTNNKNATLTYFPSGYVRMRKADNYYSFSYFDTKSGEILEEKPNDLYDEYELSDWESLTDIKKFTCDNGVGLKKNEQVILSCEWEDVSFFDVSLYKFLNSQNRDYVITNKDGNIYIINLKDESVVVQFEATGVYSYEDSTFVSFKNSSTKKLTIYNLISEKKYEFDYNANYTFYFNYFLIRNNDKKNYYNANFDLIYTEDD